MQAPASPAAITQRHEIQLRWKKYRVFTHDGKIIRIDAINPTMGEKVVYRRVQLNGRIAAHVKRHFAEQAAQVPP